MINGANLVEQVIKQWQDEGFNDQQIIDALEDGAMLEKYGITDEDQNDVENAHARIKNEMQLD